MSYKIETFKAFNREFKRLYKKYPSLKQDLAKLGEDLAINPFIGVDLGHGLRKIRMAIGSKGRGKSGGARVIFTCRIRKDTLHFLFIYDKRDMDNVEDDFIREVLSRLSNSN